MSNVHDLQRYVKRHPDDRAQRWRLAKKLYMAGDFEEALSHLRVLRKNWPTKLNIARYLAATHYRMGNNTEAIRELEHSLESWPDEVPIRQQLARALEAAGLHSAATRAWQEILSRQPSHPFAREALNNLQHRPASRPEETARVPQAGRSCPSCGAENGDEFERCWQCHAVLATDAESYSTEPPASTPFKAAPTSIDLQDHTPVTIAAIVVALVAIGISTYCFFDAWTVQHTPPAELTGGATVYTVLATGLFSLRLALGVVLAICCPIALWMTSFAVRIPMPSLGTIVAVGIASASTALAVTWLPVSFLTYAPFLYAAGVFGLIVWLFSPRYARGSIIAAVQCAVAGVICAGTAYQIEGPEFVEEVPAILKYGAKHDSSSNAGAHELPPSAVPAEYVIEFSTTDSTWLNEHGSLVRIEIGTDRPEKRMDIELFEYEESLEYYWADPATIPFNARLGRPYRLVLDGKDIPSTAKGSIISVLPLRIHSGNE